MPTIDDRHRVAALMYLSANRDTTTRLARLIDPAVWRHLEDAGHIHHPHGWMASDYLVTASGKRFLEHALDNQRREVRK